jgi:hypothetical protein
VARRYPRNSTTDGVLGQAARGQGPSYANGRNSEFGEGGDAALTPGNPRLEVAREPEGETELSVLEAVAIATALIAGLALLAALAIWWS